jgi:hypothetical protein
VIGGIAAIIGHGKPVLVKSATHEGTHFPGRRDMPCVGRAAEREIHCGTIISPAGEQPLVRLERRKLIPAPEQHESAYLLPENAVDGGVVFGI